MIKWSVYQSNKEHEDRERMVLGTFELLVWLLFGSPKYIVTINRMKEK